MITMGYINVKTTFKPETGVNSTQFIETSVYNNEGTKVNNNATPIKLSQKTLVKVAIESTMTNSSSQSFTHVKEILCYDPWVALYIAIGIFYCVWQTMGWGKNADGYDGELGDCLEKLLMCGRLFILLGVMLFGFSLCCLVK